VLISGESGTGKELIAGALHYNSARRAGPFVKLNCAAVTETLLESELFGHERGSFTGAERRREGRFVQAEGGSLFLDEVSEMSLTMQVKLLRVLQERELTRVGGEAVIRVDVRVIAATNRALAERIRQGAFREDLFYRLNVVGLEIPPLRERRDDIPLLAQHFLKNLASKNRKPVRGFSPHAMDLLVRHSWPGNVRELMNAVERGVVLSRGEFIDAEDLPLVLSPAEEVPSPDILAAIDQPLDAVERQAILGTLAAAQGNKSETARRLGITRKTLHQKLKKYGVMP
jgi:two-component system response regulator HydG